jgi:hypothetical protein
MGTFELALPSLHAVWSDELYRLHGFAPGEVTPSIELLVELTHPDDRAAVDDLLNGIVRDPDGVPLEGFTTDYRVVLRDGSVHDMRAYGRVEHGPAGARWIGAVQEVTDQLLRERELRAHYAVSQALRDWESFDEGVVDLLRRIGTALEYPMGSLWVWNRDDDALACRAFWHAPDVDPGTFEQEKRQLKFRPGQGKPGRAWATGRPAVTATSSTIPPSSRATSRSGMACARPWRSRPSGRRGRWRSSPSTASSAASRVRASCGP